MDTPRVDEQVELIENSDFALVEVVPAVFARSLEREITELRQKIEDMELQNELARLGF
jgi:hypothetical protein